MKFSSLDLNGAYALVTGASDGLGREFAFQLAAKGMNVVLVARNVDKLRETAEEIRKTSNQTVVMIPADLTQLKDIETLRQTLIQKEIKISLLVNNAGSGHWGKFEKAESEVLVKMIDLNVKAPALLASILFEDLSSSGAGAVINVASMAAVQPVPFMAAYAASKSFLSQFSLALWSEWEKQGIYVQTLMPGAIETRFDEKSGGFQAPFRKSQVSEIVHQSLADLFGSRKAVVYAKGSINQRLFAKFLPLRFLIREVAKVFAPRNS